MSVSKLSHWEQAVIHLAMWSDRFQCSVRNTDCATNQTSTLPQTLHWVGHLNRLSEVNSSAADLKQMPFETVRIDELIPLKQSHLRSHD